MRTGFRKSSDDIAPMIDKDVDDTDDKKYEYSLNPIK